MLEDEPLAEVATQSAGHTALGRRAMGIVCSDLTQILNQLSISAGKSFRSSSANLGGYPGHFVIRGGDNVYVARSCPGLESAAAPPHFRRSR